MGGPGTARRDANVHGVLIVDKPKGPTSHDVVAWARRALGTRAVGHAGTLDPMATGVLVLALGEGTKLVPYLTADEKEYDFELTLGSETDTLDAEGRVTEEAAIPALDAAVVRDVLSRFLGPQQQRPPIFSAIKVDGVPLHRQARRGVDVEAPLREVVVHDLALRVLSPPTLALTVRASKGFYVRALGRDLARALGTVGHLSVLRRTASGTFRVDAAVAGDALLAARNDEALRAVIRARVLPLERAIDALPSVMLDAAGEADARAGRRVRMPPAHDAAAGVAPGTAPGAVVALLGSDGRLVALAERHDEGLVVRRGFRAIAVDE